METLKRYRLWAIVVSCCMIVLGAAMILRPDISALAVCYLTGALMIYMGVSLLLAGVESIYTVICLSRAFKSDAHQRVIDAVWHEV